jgi:NAD(P)-dependent dehydrogenase (short-subunit alcohol dehydrogenase family)
MPNEFTQAEWDACIKVLQVLSKDPDKSLDTMTLKGLVTKLYKRAKKDIKQQTTQAVQQQIITSATSPSPDKLRKLSQKQDWLRQYDKKIILAQTVMYRKYELPDSVQIDGPAQPLLLSRFQKCYTCKTPYKEVHFFYHQLCPKCAALNYANRIQTADLTGRVALITGGRIKIGYLTALRMLRDGATVWVTTRFPKDAILRFTKEPDFADWSHRLKVMALDLRNLSNVNSFIQYFQTQEKHLDIIINNACQTVRRPAAFYRHLFDLEESGVEALPTAARQCLVGDTPFQFITGSWEQQLLPADANAVFPENRFDKDHQQIDLRTSNSWTMLLHEVPPVEMLETQLVNVTAPFLLNSQLRPMMQCSPFERKFIVNVSAMEGQFNRSTKTPFHPHTNMAKAALNMMTRTAAQEYATDGIYMNSVDTGWITQENPFQKKERIYEEEAFVPPLDEVDGMARIYDPVVKGMAVEELPLFGHFLKDYVPHAW